MPVDWDGKAASGWSSFHSGRSGTGPEPDVEVGWLKRAGKPAGSIIECGFWTMGLLNYRISLYYATRRA